MSACEACGSSNGAIERLCADLAYWICKGCGHCLMETSGDGQDEFLKAQEDYFGHESVLMQTEIGLLDREILDERVRQASACLPPAASVLEVGPGSGHVASWLKSTGRNVQLVEHSPVLSQALEAKLGLDVHTGDFAALPLSHIAVDAFCSFHVIEHVADPLEHLAIGLSLVKPGGIGLLATPNADSWQQRWFPQLSPNFDYAHLRVFSIASLAHFCERAGWKVERVETPEFTSAWLRVASRILRRLRRQDLTVTAGDYAQIAGDRFAWAYSAAAGLTWPLRRLQRLARGGNEVFLVLRRPEGR